MTRPLPLPARYVASASTLAARRVRVVAFACIAVILACGCSERRSASALPAASTVLALGDSLTYGTGASTDSSYPSVLARLSDWNVVNAGVPGETAAEGCERLSSLIGEHRPRLVLVLLGGNDFLRRLPEDGVRVALKRCIDITRANGTSIVLIAVPRRGFGGLSNAEVYAGVARESSVPVVDGGLADLLARSAMRADRVHLNSEGYRAMAANIADALRKEGFLAQ
jgi:acyl-CoA thioesterase I